MDAKYRPVAEAAGFEVETGVNVVDGHASAASIAESVVDHANAAGADILAVTSHGGCAAICRPAQRVSTASLHRTPRDTSRRLPLCHNPIMFGGECVVSGAALMGLSHRIVTLAPACRGLKCSYGSVARYCVTHFNRAILLVPPGMGSHEHRASPSLSIGINQVRELQDATSWGVHNLLQHGDTLHVLRAEEAALASQESTHQNVIMAGLREQVRPWRRHRRARLHCGAEWAAVRAVWRCL